MRHTGPLPSLSWEGKSCHEQFAVMVVMTSWYTGDEEHATRHVDVFGYAGNLNGHEFRAPFLVPPEWLLKAGGPQGSGLLSISILSPGVLGWPDLRLGSGLYVSNCHLSIYTWRPKEISNLICLKINLSPNPPSPLPTQICVHFLPRAFPTRSSDFQ